MNKERDLILKEIREDILKKIETTLNIHKEDILNKISYLDKMNEDFDYLYNNNYTFYTFELTNNNNNKSYNFNITEKEVVNDLSKSIENYNDAISNLVSEIVYALESNHNTMINNGSFDNKTAYKNKNILFSWETSDVRCAFSTTFSKGYKEIYNLYGLGFSNINITMRNKEDEEKEETSTVEVDCSYCGDGGCFHCCPEFFIEGPIY